MNKKKSFFQFFRRRGGDEEDASSSLKGRAGQFFSLFRLRSFQVINPVNRWLIVLFFITVAGTLLKSVLPYEESPSSSDEAGVLFEVPSSVPVEDLSLSKKGGAENLARTPLKDIFRPERSEWVAPPPPPPPPPPAPPAVAASLPPDKRVSGKENSFSLTLTGTLLLGEKQYCFLMGNYLEYDVVRIMRHTNPHKDTHGNTVYTMQEVSRSEGAKRTIAIKPGRYTLGSRIGQYRIRSIKRDSITLYREGYPPVVIFQDGFKKRNKLVEKQGKDAFVTVDKQKSLLNLNLSSKEGEAKSSVRKAQIPVYAAKPLPGKGVVAGKREKSAGAVKEATKKASVPDGEKLLKSVKEEIRKLKREVAKKSPVKPTFANYADIPEDIKWKIPLEELRKIPGFNEMVHISGAPGKPSRYNPSQTTADWYKTGTSSGSISGGGTTSPAAHISGR